MVDLVAITPVIPPGPICTGCPRAPPPGWPLSIAYGINASGQVVGVSAQRAFLWTPATPNAIEGTMTDLGFVGEARAINARGQVAGSMQVGGPFGGSDHAFLWTQIG